MINFTRNHIKAALFAAAAFAMLAFFAISAYAADSPTLEAVIRGDGYTYTIEADERGGTPVFYLPSTVDKSELTIRYNAGNAAYNGKLYSAGKEFTVDASSGNVSFTISAGTYSFHVMTGSEIPSVNIELDGGDGAFLSVSQNKANEASGTICVVDENGAVRFSGGLDKFKGHGLTSFVPTWDGSYKNSYNIKLAEKAELVEGSGEIRKWVLLAPRQHDGGRDSTGLSQLFAYRTHSLMTGGKYFDVKGEYVDLYVNGEYRGVYILCERMNDGGAIDVSDLEKHIEGYGELRTIYPGNADGDSAIEIGIREYTYDASASVEPGTDISGGYVLEVMCDYYEGCGFQTANGVFFTIKSPEFCTREMVEYIARCVQDFENAIFSYTGYSPEGHHFTELADMTSAADMILVYAFYQNFEFFRTSTYLYKDRDGKAHDKLTFGPVWDFETTANMLRGDGTLFGMGNGFTYNVHQQYVWAEQLWQHGGFMEEVMRENEKLNLAASRAVSEFNDVIKTSEASHAMDERRWNTSGFTAEARNYTDAVDTRCGAWFGDLFSNSYLLSVSVGLTDNGDGMVTLTSNISGNGGNVNWYVIDDTSPADLEPFGERGVDSITVPADGRLYFCEVSGPNNAFVPSAAGAVFSSQEIVMHSVPVAAAARPVDTAPDTDVGTGDQDASSGKGCGASASVPFSVVAPSVIAVSAAFAGKREASGRPNTKRKANSKKYSK